MVLSFLYTGDYRIEGKPDGKDSTVMDQSSTVIELKVAKGQQQKMEPKDDQASASELPFDASRPNQAQASEVLLTHVKVYIIADKYDIKALHSLAATRYSDHLTNAWSIDALVSSLLLIYQGTPRSDTQLRNTVIKVVGAHLEELIRIEAFKDLCQTNAELCYGALIGVGYYAIRVAKSKQRGKQWVLPKLKPCPWCKEERLRMVDWVQTPASGRHGEDEGIQFVCQACQRTTS